MRYWHPFLLGIINSAVILLLICVYNQSKPTYPTKDETSHIHRTIYIDRRFNIEEAQTIQEAAIRWTEATNHIAEIDTVLMPAEIKEADHSLSIIILDASPDLPPVISMDAAQHTLTVGIYSSQSMNYPTILIVNDRITNSNTFQKVVMHEIGHSLGLPHLEGKDGLYTLMYPTTSWMADGITSKDLIAFCDIYQCDATALQYEEEPFHF
jgi:predicted Zn-dependent protease